MRLTRAEIRDAQGKLLWSLIEQSGKPVRRVNWEILPKDTAYRIRLRIRK